MTSTSADESNSGLLWQGAVPLQLRLADADVTSLPAPEPLYVMAPRMSYLPLLAQTARDHFQEVLPPAESQPWFEFNGLPLKWGIPTGVLYDMFVGGGLLPWTLTIHFRSYPDQLLVPCESEQAVRAHFFNSLKEATCIAQGSADRVMQLSPSSQSQLWQCVQGGCDADVYNRATETLPKLPGSSMRSVAVRVYVVDLEDGWSQAATPRARSWDQVTCMSMPCSASEGGVETTLRTVVEPLLTIPFACASELTSGVVATDVWIQGVLVPLDTSLVALSSQLSHPDRFLHICLRRRRTRAEASLNVN